MSRQQFVSTLFLLIILNLIVKAIFIFGIDLQVQQEVGPSSYGLYFTLLNLCYIFQIINDFGLNQLHNTDTAAIGVVNRERWFQMIRFKIGLSIAYSVVVVVVASALGYMYAWHLLGWLILNNVLVSFILIMRAGISGTGRYRTEAFISVLDKFLMIVLCGTLLLWEAEFKIEWFVLAQTASLVITAIIAWAFSGKFIQKAHEGFQKLEFRKLLKDTLPFTLTVFLMFIYTRSDSIMIEQIMPDGTLAVGVYAAGFRLLDAANMIAFLFSPLLIPMYVKLRGTPDQTKQLIQLATGMMIVMAGTISIASFFWAREIMAACYGVEDHNWITTFRYLILSHLPVGLMYIYSSYLTATKELKKQNLLFAGSVVINLTLNWIFISQLGTIGAAVAALITQTGTTIGLILITQSVVKDKIDMILGVRSVLYLIILCGLAWALYRVPLHWMAEAGMFFALALIAAFFMRLLHLHSFLELLKKRQQIQD